MKNVTKKVVSFILAAVMIVALAIPAFAYTAVDDDGNRGARDDTTMNVVYTNSGMLRIVDEGTSVALSEDMKSVNVTIKTSESKTWGKVTKVALIEGTATDEEKAEAAANVILDDPIYSETAMQKTFHYSIPVGELGMKIPICVYQGTEEGEGEWKTYNDQSYYTVLYTMDLYQKLQAAYASATDDAVKAELENAIKKAEAALQIKDLALEKLNGVMMTINAARLYKESDVYKLDLTINGTSYTKVYQGYASEANKDDTGAIDVINDAENKVSYVTLPISALNEPLVFAFKGSKYFNRTLTVSEESLSYDNTALSLAQFDSMTLDEALARAEADTSVDTVNALIEAIQVQIRDENTDKYCALAKAYYDVLSASDKKKVEESDYFDNDTGDAADDKAKEESRQKEPIGEKELLVVSFGTSFNESRQKTILAVENALEEAYPDYSVRRAFTAQIIINHIAAREGYTIDNMEQALDRAVANGVKALLVQPTHLMHGAEYDEMCEALDAYKEKFDRIDISEPLLNSDEDKTAVAKAVVAETIAESAYETRDAAEADKTAIVYMGHGTSHEANVTYTEMQGIFDGLGYKNVFVGTVEGKPASTALPEVKKAVEEAGYSKVILRPLMVVAGDHANNDMAADEEGSWYYAFVNGGEFEVEGADEPVDIGAGLGAENVTCQISGLGEIADVQQLYVAHVKEAIPVSLKTAKVTLEKTSYTYTNKAIKPAVKKVVVDGVTLAKSDYQVAYKNNTKAGTATVTITGKGHYKDSATAKFTIKAAKPKISAKTKTVKASKVKKKAQKVSAITVKNAYGKVTFQKVAKGSSKYLTVNKNTGKITVKKGAPKKTHQIKVKVTAAKASGKNTKLTKTITVKVQVK